MSKRVFKFFLLMLLPLTLNACTGLKKRFVGLYLKKSQDVKAGVENLKLTEPPSSYLKKEHDVLDAFWWNASQSSSLSYFSSCSDIPRSLKAFQISSYPNELNYKLLKRLETEDSIYSLLGIEKQSSSQNKLESKNSQNLVESKPANSEENYQSYIAVHSLRKRNCFFNLNLVAPSHKVFLEEEENFQNFIKGFKPL